MNTNMPRKGTKNKDIKVTPGMLRIDLTHLGEHSQQENVFFDKNFSSTKNGHF
jgi:hypothetical protein